MKTYLRYCLVFILILGYKNASANNVAASGTLSSDASLQSIVLSTATTLVFSTGSANYNYTTSVDPTTTSLSVEPTSNDPNATVTVNGVVVRSGNSSGQITLNGIVTTTINLVSISQDKTDTLTYSVVVYESGSNDAFLSALTVSTGNALVKSATGAGNYNYTTSVSPATTSLTVTPTTADPTAAVTVNGVAVASGSASGAIPLNPVGSTTTITSVVTAQDGVTKLTYSIVVSRTGSNISTLSALSLSTLSPLFTSTGSSVFSASNLNYTALVSSTTTSVTVKPTVSDPGSTVTVNGTAVTSGSSSAAIGINASGTTLITVVVTAQDLTTQSTYTITISKNAAGVGNSASWSSIVLSTGSSLVGTSPTFTTSVSASTTSLTVTITTVDPNASIVINGASVASGVASGAITLNATGTTPITGTVTSSDGSKSATFTITVSKNGSNNASTSSISVFDVTTGTPAALVSTGGTNYTSAVNATTTQATITAIASDANATVTISVGGVVQQTGTGSAVATITLNAAPGPTTVSIKITAQDGVTTNTYSVAISQTGSTNANVTSIAINPTGVLVNSTAGSANYNAGYHANYTASVSATATSVTVNTTAADKNAVITLSVNGAAAVTVSTGVAYTVTLTPVSTFVLVNVTSPSTTVTYSYGITIYPSGSNNASIQTPVLSTGTTLTSTVSYFYTTTVSPNTTTVTVTTTTVDPNATLSVNGLAAVSGSPSSPITLNATGTTTISIVCTAQDGHTTKTNTITISKSGIVYTWTGAASTVWTNTGNWSPAAVPGAGDVVSFANTVVNQPAIAASTTIGEIDFGSGSTTSNTTITLSAGIKLTVGTNLTVNTGSTATIKSAGGTAPSVDIAAAATLNVTGTGILNITSPVTFTLKSVAAGSASVGQITTGSITGSVTVERYIQGGSNVYRGYRLLSSPVYAATVSGNNVYSINYVQTKSFVTGPGNAANGFDVSPSGNPSLYLFREDQASNNNSFTGGNYWGISKINNTPTYNYNLNSTATLYNIPVGNGFFFFYRGDRIGPNKFTSTTVAESTTMSTTGTLNQGQITVHDWYTPASPNLGFTNTPGNASIQGFNLVGNPYASSIDWDTYNTGTPNTGIYAPNVATAIYIIDPVSKNYGVYIANSSFGGTNNATHVIPSGQGFFVQATGAGASLTFNENAKITTQVTGPNLLLGIPVANAVSQFLHLKLTKDSVQADEIFISFKSNAQSKYVFGEDAPQKPGFGTASLSSLSSDGVPLSINTLALPGQSESIALNVNSTTDGTYQLAIPEVKSIPAIYDVWLMDAYKKDSVNVRQTANYTFSITKTDTASFGSTRFSLIIRQNPGMALHLLNFSAAKATNGAQIVWKTVNEENYTNFTVERSTDNGQTFVELGGFLSSAEGTYSFLDKNPQIALDQYRLKIVDLDGAISYSKIVPLLYSTLSDNVVKNTISVYPNPTSGVINLAINQNSSSASASSLSALQTLSSPVLVNNQTESSQSYDIRIISITGNVVKKVTSSQPSWQDNLSSLLPGTYVIQVLNSSDKSLVGKSTFVKL